MKAVKLVILTIVLGLFAPAVYADMVVLTDDYYSSVSQVSRQSEAVELADAAGNSFDSEISDPLCTEILADFWQEEDSSAAVEAVSGDSGNVGSFGLCLSALSGIGLCRFARSIKSVHFGNVPEWCHESGPQMGHSYAVTPETFNVQTVCIYERPKLNLKLIPLGSKCDVYFLMLSQYIPNMSESRGPPTMG